MTAFKYPGREKGDGAIPAPGVLLSQSDKLKDEYQVYDKIPEIIAEQIKYPTSALWLYQKVYCMCIAGSVCASQRVFSTSGLIVSPTELRLSQKKHWYVSAHLKKQGTNKEVTIRHMAVLKPGISTRWMHNITTTTHLLFFLFFKMWLFIKKC